MGPPPEGAEISVRSKPEAQQRADRVAAFRAELADLERAGVLTLPAEQRSAVERHHELLLRDLAERFDVDVVDRARQLSLGMRVVSFLGAMALALSVFLFFQRFWGLLTVPVQVAILAAAPALALLLTDVAARRERTGTFASLLGLVAFACLVLDVTMLGQIFNVTPSEHAFLAWAAFGLLLGYAYGLRLLVAAGGVCLLVWLAAQGTWGGLPWTEALAFPEHFLVAGLLIFAVPLVRPHRRRPEIEPVYRLLGLLAVLSALLILSSWGEGSRLPVEPGTAEILYQVLAFAASGAAIALGLRRRWRDVVYAGGVFFVLHLYVRFFDWWFDWMPKYLFFLILGLTAVAALALLRRLRAALGGAG